LTKTEKLNVVAMNAVLTAMFGEEVVTKIREAYTVATAACETAYEVGYQDAYDDYAEERYFDGFQDGFMHATEASTMETAETDQATAAPAMLTHTPGITGQTNYKGQPYDCALGRFMREWLIQHGLIQQGYDSHLPGVDTYVREFMDGFWGSTLGLPAYIREWMIEKGYGDRSLDDMVEEFLTDWDNYSGVEA
jgi:hypothetical protein